MCILRLPKLTCLLAHTMVITLRLLLTCVFSVVSCAEPESPYTVLNSSGRMTRSIDYSIFDRHSLASLIKNHPNKEDLDVLCAVTYGKYTRFTFNNLAQNINQFKDKAEALKKGLIDERLLQEQTPIEIKKALIKDTLQALSLPLPEDDETTRGAIVVHLKKKFISAFFQKGSDALRIIVYDEDLSQLAFSMVIIFNVNRS